MAKGPTATSCARWGEIHQQLVSHRNLPDLAMAQDPFPTNPAQNFDRLFSGHGATMAQAAIYAHVHHGV
ncbi:hypothetical protein ACW18Z_05035 [Limosilactobacillus fermentum]